MSQTLGEVPVEKEFKNEILGKKQIILNGVHFDLDTRIYQLNL